MEKIISEDDYQSHYDMGMSYKEMELFEGTGIAKQEGMTPSGGGDVYKQYVGA